MERIDAQTIITLLLEDVELREEVLRAIEPVEVRRLYDEQRDIRQRMREIEAEHAYLEMQLRELQARHRELEERVRRAEAIIYRILKGEGSDSSDRALGFLIVRKPWNDTTLN